MSMIVFCPVNATRRNVGPKPMKGARRRRRSRYFPSTGNSHAVAVRCVENDGYIDTGRALPCSRMRVNSAEKSSDNGPAISSSMEGPITYRSAQTFALPNRPLLSEAQTAETGTPTLSPGEGLWAQAAIDRNRKKSDRNMYCSLAISTAGEQRLRELTSGPYRRSLDD